MDAGLDTVGPAVRPQELLSDSRATTQGQESLKLLLIFRVLLSLLGRR
jgi:hypothetical protein